MLAEISVFVMVTMSVVFQQSIRYDTYANISDARLVYLLRHSCWAEISVFVMVTMSVVFQQSIRYDTTYGTVPHHQARTMVFLILSNTLSMALGV